MLTRLKTILLTLALLLSSCVYLPVTETTYDPKCKVNAKHMTLEPVQIAAITHCHRDECAVFLAAATVTATASAIISGSIVIIGNVVYWFEELGQCTSKSDHD